MKFVKLLRRINTFVLVSGLFFLLQNYTIGLIPVVRRVVLFNTVYLKDVVFIASSVLLTLSTVRLEPDREIDN